MSCRELVESLREYLDGEARWYGRLMIGLHLRLCSACRAYLASYQKTLRLAKGLAEADAGAALPAALLERVRRTAGRPGK